MTGLRCCNREFKFWLLALQFWAAVHLHAAPLIEIESPPGNVLTQYSVLDFGTQALGSAMQRAVRVRNVGDAPVSELALALPTLWTIATGFSLGSLSSTTLLPGEHVDFTVTFAPVDGGGSWDQVLISSDQPGVSFRFSMSGMGEGPEIGVSSPNILSAGIISSPAFQHLVDGVTTVPFGFGRVSQVPRERGALLLSNLGTQPLHITGVSFSGPAASDFSVTALPGTLAVGSGIVSFTFSFSPAAVGVRNAVFHIFCNDSNEASFDIPLQGFGMSQLEEWRIDHFGMPGSVYMLFEENNWNDHQDPDGDGIPNLLEFATGQHPLSSTTPAQSFTIGTSGECLYTYKRSKAAVNDGLIFAVQHNSTFDPAGWNSAGVTETILSDDGTLQTVRVTAPAPAGNACFMRLRVQKP